MLDSEHRRVQIVSPGCPPTSCCAGVAGSDRQPRSNRFFRISLIADLRPPPCRQHKDLVVAPRAIPEAHRGWASKTRAPFPSERASTPAVQGVASSPSAAGVFFFLRHRSCVSGGSIALSAGWGALDSLTSLSRERVRHVSDTELLHKSKGEPVRRFEIFTGSGRRRVWTSEQKAEILAESYESGDKVSAVARRHGLTPQQLFGWRRNAQRRTVRRRGASPAAGSVTFTPVMVDVSMPDARPPAATVLPGSAAGMIEIVLGAATVRVGAGTDVATLTKVLRAVKAAT